MAIHYDTQNDTLSIVLREQTYDFLEYERGDFTVSVDDADELTQIVIRNASTFVAQALSAGLTVAEDTQPAAKPQGMVWEEADSSMISSFGYDAAKQILDVAFHKTGVYRYFNVPLDVVEGLRKASSQGSYMRSMIIDVYDYEKRGR